MNTMCIICRSVKRVEHAGLRDADKNSCYEDRGFSDSYQYHPSKKIAKIDVRCNNFSHVRSMKIR